MDSAGYPLYNPRCDIFHIQTLWDRLVNSHLSRVDALAEAVMSADHHLDRMASPAPVSMMKGIPQAVQRRTQSPSPLHYQCLLHRIRVQNQTNECSSKARNEWKLMKLENVKMQKGIVDERVGQYCEVSGYLKAEGDVVDSVQDRKTNYLNSVADSGCRNLQMSPDC